MFRDSLKELQRKTLELEENLRESLKYAIQRRDYELADKLVDDLWYFLTSIEKENPSDIDIISEINSLFEDDIKYGTIDEDIEENWHDYTDELIEKRNMNINNNLWR